MYLAILIFKLKFDLICSIGAASRWTEIFKNVSGKDNPKESLTPKSWELSENFYILCKHCL